MSAQTCIVMPGRFGDIINILPCARDIALKQGGNCAIMVSAEFASVLDGCSYVEPVVISSHFTDIQPAIAQAQEMFAKVLVAKVNEKSVGVTTQCGSFNEESWRQIGYWGMSNDEGRMTNAWETLPLVFDRMDREREKRLNAETQRRREDKKVLVNFSGKSAPFEHGDEIKRMFSGAWDVVDLGSIRAHRIYDLLGLMDAAQLLITGDTATMHLAAASGIPVVNLIGDQPTRWHGSKPRNNSVLEIRYSEVHRLKEIWTVPLPWRPRTWHVWSDYVMSGEALRRHQLARSTWPTAWIDLPVRENKRVINDQMRSLPFIRDLMAHAVDCAGPHDRIVLTNADTCVSDEAAARIEEALRERGCAYSFRRDFMALPLGRLMNQEVIRSGRHYPGADLFACTVDWWQKHGRLLPDLVLGAEAWDWCLRTLMHTTGGAQFDDLIYHEAHPNEWERPEHRNALPSQLHNKRLAAPFLAEYGVAFQ
jgi:hypothetical protein